MHIYKQERAEAAMRASLQDRVPLCLLLLLELWREEREL
jgi:hypothetical protein